MGAPIRHSMKIVVATAIATPWITSRVLADVRSLCEAAKFNVITNTGWNNKIDSVSNLKDYSYTNFGHQCSSHDL